MTKSLRSRLVLVVAAVALPLTCEGLLFAGGVSEPCPPALTLSVVPDKEAAGIGYALYTQFRATAASQCDLVKVAFSVSGDLSGLVASFDRPIVELKPPATSASSILLVSAETGASGGLEARKALDWRAFCNGVPGFVGSRLGESVDATTVDATANRD